MRTLDKICDIFESELEEIAKKPEINQSDLNVAGELIDAIKDIAEIDYYKGMSGYSNSGPWYIEEVRGNNGYSRGYDNYGRGNSYGRMNDGRYNDGQYSMDGRERFARDMENLRQNYNGMN